MVVFLPSRIIYAVSYYSSYYHYVCIFEMLLEPSVVVVIEIGTETVVF